MFKLIILADDFTGALDTGVQLSKVFVNTFVTSDINFDLKNNNLDYEVIVINMESRHLSKNDAYNLTKEIVKKAVEANILYIYKKTDSALRGNIGAELSAVSNSVNSPVFFIPAFPKNNRITKNGIHYIDGVPVSASVFGKDPFNPVVEDEVSTIIKKQSDIDTKVITKNMQNINLTIKEKSAIYIFDSENIQDFENIGSILKNKNKLNFLAGCAGFAEILPKLLDLKISDEEKIDKENGLIVISASVNQVTKNQIEYAINNGFSNFTLPPSLQMTEDITKEENLDNIISEIRAIYSKNKKIIIDVSKTKEDLEKVLEIATLRNMTLENTREVISNNIGTLVCEIVSKKIGGNLIIFGGDSLAQSMKKLDVFGIVPIKEIESGVVFSKAISKNMTMGVVSKSGGFGKEDVLMQIENFFKN